MMSRFAFSTLLSLIITTLLSHGLVAAQEAGIDLTKAQSYFREAEALCTEENGKLWGVSLCSPILLVDPKTRNVVANQADAGGKLRKNGDVFVGSLPPEIIIANTATNWSGVNWTMILLPLPADKHRRRDLMAHEMWHRVQNEIGFPSSGAANNHLDSLAGRLWLQLEWRALEAALSTRGLRRRKAISDALIFRGYRRTLFPRAAIEEREMEMHEGLAEYTGAILSGALDLGHYVNDRWLTETPKQPTFARSFAYASGPAYGLLLDQSQSNWRRRLGKGEDLGELLRKSQHIRLKPQTEQSVWRYARSYGAVMLQRSELEREKIRQKRVEEYKSRLVEGPVLAIQLRQMTMQMNPGNLVPLDSLGTVYPDVKIADAWGILTVTKGALIKSDFSTVYVPAPANFHGLDLEGDGWTLQLNKGWEVVGGARKGDYVLKPLR